MPGRRWRWWRALGRAMLVIGLGLPAGGCSGPWFGPAKPDSGLQVGAPVVYIHPIGGDIGWKRKVGVLPFQVPASADRGEGLRVAALFKDVLLGKKVFRTVAQVPMPFGTYEEALALGRRYGCDYVLAGRLGTVLESSELGGARLEVSVRLLATATGDTIWYLEQAVDQPLDYLDQGLSARAAAIFTPQSIRTSGAAPVLPNMLARVARDMAEVMVNGRSR